MSHTTMIRLEAPATEAGAIKSYSYTQYDRLYMITNTVLRVTCKKCARGRVEMC